MERKMCYLPSKLMDIAVAFISDVYQIFGQWLRQVLVLVHVPILVFVLVLSDCTTVIFRCML